LAVVIVILVAGLAGAYLSVTVWRSKHQTSATASEEAQQICDAGLEMARAALVQWRNQDINVRPLPTDPIPWPSLNQPPQARDPQYYAWNKVFYWSSYVDSQSAGMGIGASGAPDPVKVRDDAMARLKKGGVSGTWAYGADDSYNYASTNTPQTLTSNINPSLLSSAGNVDQCIKDLFGVNRRYGKGCFHLALKNNTGEIHGNGVDQGVPSDGNPWRWDPAANRTNPPPAPPTPIYAGDPITVAPITMSFPSAAWVCGAAGAYTGCGQFDPFIDGDGQAILYVTATLPDGTVHQVEVLLSYPFQPGGPVNAIQDAGNISMNGAFTVLGTLGNVHANGNISGNGGGQAQVSGVVGASGSNSLTMNNAPPGGILANTAPVPINPVSVPSFKNDPKYSSLQSQMIVFNNNGTITNNTSLTTPTNFTFTPSGPGGLGTWSMSGGGSTPPSGVYYFAGNFSAQGQGNSGPYTMAIIAEGSVDIGGNAKFAAPAGIDQLIVAGQDIFLHGTGNVSGAQFTGNAFANEQVKIQGNFTLNGSITGANATDTPGSIVSSQSSLSPDLTLGGTPNIVYDGMGSIIQQNVDHLDLKGLRRLR
jgi:hypothetical protein